MEAYTVKNFHGFLGVKTTKNWFLNFWGLNPDDSGPYFATNKLGFKLRENCCKFNKNSVFLKPKFTSEYRKSKRIISSSLAATAWLHKITMLSL